MRSLSRAEEDEPPHPARRIVPRKRPFIGKKRERKEDSLNLDLPPGAQPGRAYWLLELSGSERVVAPASGERTGDVLH